MPQLLPGGSVCQTQVHQHQHTKAVFKQQTSICIHAKLSRTCCLCIQLMPVLCLMHRVMSNRIVMHAGDQGLC
jgi:hypothetical protein